ncbi:MAG: PhoU domain-containing protein [Blautia sp.]|nr:PhoU domain-containing protein [Blautia sp.]
MYVQTADMMITGNSEGTKKILKQKEEIMDLGIKMRKSHVQRVGKGKCVAKLTESYNKIIHSVDRMGNCCINMVDAVQGQIGLRYFLEYSGPDVKEV